MLDDRIIRVGIEVAGQLKIYEGLNIKAAGTKYGNNNQNECTVQIMNMDRDSRNFILTETSPFNRHRVLKRLVVWAGRKSYGVQQIFQGDITEASVSQPPDIVLQVKALTANFEKGNIVARNGGDTMNLSELSQTVARDLGVQLEFQATDKKIAAYSYTGSAVKQVDKLAEIGLVDAYVDDGVLVVKNMNIPLSNRTRILNKNSGMIGIPELTEHGVRVKFLLDNQTQVGTMLTIQSELNPSLNGNYTIYKLSFDISNRDQQFYYIAEGVRIDR